MGNASGKVWSTLITTQQGGICPKRSLGFAIYGASSPTPIYCHFALQVYSPMRQYIGLRVLSVKPGDESSKEV